MSRAKLFNMIKSRGEQTPGRNPFDLTNRHVYSQKAAKITPVKAIHTYPDDFFKVSMSEFTQNKVPLNTAAFLTGKKEMLAYFVPYNTIWHNFNQYQATREDPESTLLKERGISFEPRIALRSLYFAALNFAFGSFLFNKYLQVYALLRFHATLPTMEGGDTIPELIANMKATPFNSSDPNYSIWDEYMSVAFTMAKTKVYNEFYDADVAFFGDFSFYEFDQDDEHVTLYDAVTNMFGNYIWCDWIQKLDMLGYGNIYPIVSRMLSRLNTFIDDNILNNNNSECVRGADITFVVDGETYSLNQNFNYFDEPVDVDSSLLYDILKSANDSIQSISKNGDSFEFVNVYSIYAYNKCFYDYMRNVYYDTDYSVYNFNCDFIDGSSLAGSIIPFSKIPLRWYHLECHQWKKDMFTGCLPDNQLGLVSSVTIDDARIKNQDLWLIDSMQSSANNNYYKGNDLNPSAGALSVTSSGIMQDSDNNNISHKHGINLKNLRVVDASFNVLALKRAEAIQQYRQDLMRAGNRTADIFKQIYGASPKSQLEESPYFIEVKSNDLNINPIISTAQTGDGINQSLGDIAARCTISGADLEFNFSTKDFGVIILLSYIVPDSFYNSYRLDPMNCHLDQESHGLPYFQNLGLQPVIGSYLSNLKSASVRNRTLGYAPPYLEFKTDIDLVHGDFVDAFMPRVNNDEADFDYQGEMSHWVVARTDMQQEDTVSLRNFYIDPRILNNVFTFSAGDDYSTDHFFTYCQIKVEAIRAFSELGLPRF